MASEYRQAPQEIHDLLAEVIASTHKDLKAAGVTISIMTAHAKVNEEGEPEGPALKHHGYPAAAVIKVNSYKDRVEGKDDATLLIDGDRWDEFSIKKQRGLIDHELTHLVVQRGKRGGIKTDKCGRPCLKTRPHDAEIGVFYDVVERHGEDALETVAYKEMHKAFSQKLLPWG